VKGGSNPNQVNYEGVTPLHVAVKKQNNEACRELLHWGRKIHPTIDVNLQTYNGGETALHLACANNCYQIIEMLCE